MIFVNNVKIGKNLYISIQDNGIITANDDSKKPFFVYSLAEKKPLFANKKKAKKTLAVCVWISDFLDGKREIIYSNGLIFGVKKSRLGFYKLETIA